MTAKRQRPAKIPFIDASELLDRSARRRARADLGLTTVLARITADPADIPVVSFAAKIAEMTSDGFRARFLALTGRRYRQFVKEIRLVLALRLLSLFDWTVGACADWLGYGQQSTLCSLFTRELGRPPRTFRMACRPISQATLSRMIERMAAGRPFRDLIGS